MTAGLTRGAGWKPCDTRQSLPRCGDGGLADQLDGLHYVLMLAMIAALTTKQRGGGIRRHSAKWGGYDA